MAKRIVCGERGENEERATIESNMTTRQRLRIVASLQGMTMGEWLDWSVDRAYESAYRDQKKHVN